MSGVSYNQNTYLRRRNIIILYECFAIVNSPILPLAMTFTLSLVQLLMVQQRQQCRRLHVPSVLHHQADVDEYRRWEQFVNVLLLASFSAHSAHKLRQCNQDSSLWFYFVRLSAWCLFHRKQTSLREITVACCWRIAAPPPPPPIFFFE